MSKTILAKSNKELKDLTVRVEQAGVKVGAKSNKELKVFHSMHEVAEINDLQNPTRN